MTKHLRKMQQGDSSIQHISIQKWSQSGSWSSDPRSMWKLIWAPYIPEKISCFVWQVMYHAATTNTRHFPILPNADSQRHYERCIGNMIETIEPCLWECPKAASIWRWITFLGPLTAQDPDQLFIPLMSQALIGEPLEDDVPIPKIWWQLLRMIAMWFIWKERNTETIPKQPEMMRATQAKICHQIRISLRVEWEKRIGGKTKTEEDFLRIRYLFEFDVGVSDRVFTNVGSSIQVNMIPPEPD